MKNHVQNPIVLVLLAGELPGAFEKFIFRVALAVDVFDSDEVAENIEDRTDTLLVSGYIPRIR